MAALRKFEVEAIQLMVDGVLTPQQVEVVSSLPEAARYEYTGSGYYLTVSHPSLPVQPAKLSVPAVVGEAGNISCGFVVFLGNGELTLECHTWGSVDVPSNFRSMSVSISTPHINVVNPKPVAT